MYQQAGPTGEAGQPGGSAGGDGKKGSGEDVVDAEFTEA
jgi:hypothetical protein